MQRNCRTYKFQRYVLSSVGLKLTTTASNCRGGTPSGITLWGIAVHEKSKVCIQGGRQLGTFFTTPRLHILFVRYIGKFKVYRIFNKLTLRNGRFAVVVIVFRLILVVRVCFCFTHLIFKLTEKTDNVVYTEQDNFKVSNKSEAKNTAKYSSHVDF